MYQTTLNKRFTFLGVGLHSGEEMPVTVLPAGGNCGIQFKRTDVLNCPFVRITPFNVSSTQLATTIMCDDFPISTIEHIMSALYGLGVDNAYIEVGGPEIPILDGSSLPIAELIQKIGVCRLEYKRKYMKILKQLIVEIDDKFVQVDPYDGFKITYEIEYEHAAIQYQKRELTLDTDKYLETIAYARTFGFKKDVEMLRNMGLAKGGSIDNAILLDDDDSIMNPGGLRHKDEFVNHKILDLIGDISLVGHRLIGHMHARKAGHHINNIFARKLVENLNLYSIVELDEDDMSLFYEPLRCINVLK